MNDDERAVSTRRKPRPALGLVSHPVAGTTAWWLGAAEVARQQDVDLFVFNASNIGEQIANQDTEPYAIHNLIGPERLDSLVLVQWWPTRQVFEQFYQRYYRPLPVVNVHRYYEGHPGVLVDSHAGMFGVIRHLIEVHGYRRLAYIGGLPDNASAIVRYQTYVAALAAYDIPLDENLVAPGDFSPQSGTNAVRVLLDERGLRPKVDFDAIVASNDNMALAAMAELHRRGFDVPLDVAVVGFDDVAESAFTAPPLTTVRMPNYEMGRAAVEMALAALRGEPAAEYVTVPGVLVVRQSCGCFVSPLAAAGEAGGPPPHAMPEIAPAEQRAQALVELARVLGPAGQHLRTDWATALLDAFEADISVPSGGPPAGPPGAPRVPAGPPGSSRPPAGPSGSPGPSSSRFLATLYAIVRQLHVNGYDLLGLGRALLLTVRRCMQPTLTDVSHMRRAEAVWQQGMAFVADVAHQMQTSQQYYGAGYIEQLRVIGEQLITTFEMAQLLDLIARELPRLNIPSCYIALYAEAERQNARLLLAYNAQGRDPLGLEGQMFPARQLLPEGLLPQERSSVLVVAPLYFQQTALGYALFEVGPEQGDVYEMLSRQISSALMGALLVQQQEQAQRDADAARQRAQAALSDLLTTRSISDRVRQAADTEAILRVTLESLGQALGASTAVARLGTREQLLEAGAEAELS